jgi:hypothetical protein
MHYLQSISGDEETGEWGFHFTRAWLPLPKCLASQSHLLQGVSKKIPNFCYKDCITHLTAF